MLKSCLRSVTAAIVFIFSFPLLAADKDQTESYERAARNNACERLLEADLSGFFVVTHRNNPEESGNRAKHSQLVHLRRLGHSAAYMIAAARLNLVKGGIRELEMGPTNQGWLVGDPADPKKRVNVMSLRRDASRVNFDFETVGDNVSLYGAQPSEDKMVVQGDILHPDGWIVNFDRGFHGEVQFTRIKLDRLFEQTVSQSLKSLLATRLDSGDTGDFLVTVEMRRPMTTADASEVLGPGLLYPIEDRPDENETGYRFAMPKNVYELLEAVGKWTRRWEVAHIDVVSARDQEVLSKIVRQGERVRQEMRDESKSPPPPETLDRLQQFENELNKGRRPQAAVQQPPLAAPVAPAPPARRPLPPAPATDYGDREPGDPRDRQR